MATTTSNIEITRQAILELAKASGMPAAIIWLITNAPHAYSTDEQEYAGECFQFTSKLRGRMADEVRAALTHRGSCYSLMLSNTEQLSCSLVFRMPQYRSRPHFFGVEWIETKRPECECGGCHLCQPICGCGDSMCETCNA